MATKKTTRPTGTTTTTFALTMRDYSLGDCVTWSQKAGNDQRDTHTVSCSKPHLLEISGSLDLSERFDHYPSKAELDLVDGTVCAQQVSALIGRPLDPYGKFAPENLHPFQDAWTNGYRKLWCGAAARWSHAPPSHDESLPFTGRVEGADQTSLEPIGSCWTAKGRYAVPCATPHTNEVAGYADLTNKGLTSVPALQDDRAWQNLVGDQCDQIARNYLGYQPVGDVFAGWSPIEAASWLAGRRLVECIVGHGRANEWLTSTGSLKH